jgi:hypothetical protein
MTIEQQTLHKLRGLSPERQQQVLDFVNSFTENDSPKMPLRSLKGLWAADTVPAACGDSFSDARREMWGNFPRDIS